MKRDEYFKNYELAEKLSKNGRRVIVNYKYIGKWCAWTVPYERIKEFKKKFTILFTLSLILWVISLCLDNKVNSFGVVEIPALLLLGVYVYNLIAIVTFLVSKDVVREPDIREIHNHLSAGALLAAFLLGIAGVGAVAYFFIHNTSYTALLISACNIAAAIMNGYISDRMYKLEYTQTYAPDFDINALEAQYSDKSDK